MSHEVKTETKKQFKNGKGKRVGAAFLASVVEEKLTPEQRAAKLDFYQAWAVQEIQFRQICREQGCRY